MYLDACGLLLIVVCAGVLLGVYRFAALVGVASGPEAWQFVVSVGVAAKVAASLWLGVLVLWRRARYRFRFAAVALAGGTIYTNAAAHQAFPQYPTGSEVAFTLALAWLTVEILRRHGITCARFGLYPPNPRTPADRLTMWKVSQQVLFLSAVSLLAVDALIWLLRRWGAGLAVTHTSQATALGWTSPWQLLPSAVYSAVLEDVVMVGALTALLTLLRRPAWEIYAIAIGLEVAGHLYFGLPALALIPYVVLRLRLYRRHRQLTPLIAPHIALDIGGGLLPFLQFPGRLLLAVSVAISICLAEQHLTTRATADPADTHPKDLPWK